MTYIVSTYAGEAKYSGHNSCVYVQLGCGRKASPDEFYVGESQHGHGGRYTGYYGTSGDKLRVATPVRLVMIERTRGAMSMVERRLMEGLLVDECAAHPLLAHRLVTTNALVGAAGFIEPRKRAAMLTAIQKTIEHIEAYFQ